MAPKKTVGDPLRSDYRFLRDICELDSALSDVIGPCASSREAP